MTQAGIALIIAGSMLGLVGSILMLVSGFRVSVGWGIALLFIPGLAILPFLVLHWPEARIAFVTGLASFVLVIGGAVAFAGGANPQAFLDALMEQAAPIEADIVPPAPPAPAEPTPAPARPPPAAEPASLVGGPLDAVEVRFGEPRIVFRHGDRTFYVYDGWEFEADAEGRVVRAEPMP